MPGLESRMKIRGEEKIWKDILTKKGSLKSISSTQIGSKLLMDEAMRILPDMVKWINEDSASIYRNQLKSFFTTEDITLQKILEVFFLLVSSSYVDNSKENSKNKIVTRHRKVVLIKKKLFPELSFDVVWRFLEVLIDYSQYFFVEKDLVYKKNKSLWSIKYSCNLPEVIFDKLALKASLSFFPEPMTTPPLDWSFKYDDLEGGYKNFQYQLVRTFKDNIDYNKYSDNIFNAINYIQKVPWQINKELVNQIERDLKKPIKEDFIKTEFPNMEICQWKVDIKSLGEKESKRLSEIRKRFGEEIELYNAEYGDYESELGKYRAIKLALGIAKRYINEDKIYFPHSYDFRGRIYPISVGLSPQGSDTIKSMIQYYNSTKLTKSGENWCWAYLASLYGDDKIPFKQRIERGKELINTNYKEADEPYQFLAHQLELKKYIEDNNYRVKIRIHLDACNSGSQFTSVITNDRDGCEATNVIPVFDKDGVQIRRDAYIMVSNKSLEITKAQLKNPNSENKYSLKLIKKLLEENGRKLCKRPVMVSNYGGTARGRADIIWDMFRELHVDREDITKNNASLMAGIVGEATEGVLKGGKAFERYIQQMNNIIAKFNKPVTWTTSDGFYVIHKKFKELKRKQVTCMLPQARKATTINKKIFSDKLSVFKMRSAISPNYIHSLDAELLRMIALEMKYIGIEDIDVIHDSFGCNPNHVDKMLEIIKEQFIKLIKTEPLKLLDYQLRKQAPKTKPVMKKLSKIDVPDLLGLNVYNGDLDSLMDSDWFFS